MDAGLELCTYTQTHTHAQPTCLYSNLTNVGDAVSTKFGNAFGYYKVTEMTFHTD